MKNFLIVLILVIALAVGTGAQGFADRIQRSCSSGVTPRAMVITNPNNTGDVAITTCTGGDVTVNGAPIIPGAGFTPDSIIFAGAAGGLSEAPTFLTYNHANRFLTYDADGNGGSRTDLSSWALSTVRFTRALDAASGKFYILAIQPYATGNSGSVVNYEKAGILVQAKTNDPSGATTRDMVGIDSRGIIASTNSTGRAWGIATQGVVEAGGDGLTVAGEFGINNAGTDQPAVSTTTSKYGLHIVASGNGASAGVMFTGSGGGFHKMIYAQPGDILGTNAADRFIELLNTWSVTKTGATAITSGANNTTLLTLKRNTDTAPTGNFADFQNAAGTSLWKVSITGAVTAVSYTGPRLGVTTNSNACAGCIAENIEATLPFGSAITPATGVSANVISQSLPAGDYDVTGWVDFISGATTTIGGMQASISLTTATHDLGIFNWNNKKYASGTVLGNVDNIVIVGPRRISLASTTTIFLVASSDYGTSTMTVFGGLKIRRVN